MKQMSLAFNAVYSPADVLLVQEKEVPERGESSGSGVQHHAHSRPAATTPQGFIDTANKKHNPLFIYLLPGMSQTGYKE